MTEAPDSQVAADFASLMLAAKPDPEPVDPEAPYGRRVDGTPKKGPGGRPVRKSPSLDELKTAKAGQEAASPPPGDRPPAKPSRRQRRGRAEAPRDDHPAPPMPKGGQIAAGMNRLYRTAGRVLQALNAPDTRGRRAGVALAEITRKSDPDDVTVGEAWEKLAASNPRVRAFLLRLVSGGAAGELVWCHVPVVIALMVGPDGDVAGPVGSVLGAMMVPDGPSEPGASPAGAGGPSFGEFVENMSPEDMAGLAQMAQRMAGGPVRGE